MRHCRLKWPSLHKLWLSYNVKCGTKAAKSLSFFQKLERTLKWCFPVVIMSTVRLLVRLPWNRSGGSGWRYWGITQATDSRLNVVRSSNPVCLKKEIASSSYRTLIRKRSDALARRAEGMCRIFLSPARSQSHHTVAPTENVTFPLQAHLPVFFSHSPYK